MVKASQVQTHTSAHPKQTGKVGGPAEIRTTDQGIMSTMDVLIGSENSLPYSTFQPLTRNEVLIHCDWA